MTTPAEPSDPESSQPFQPAARAQGCSRRWWGALALTAVAAVLMFPDAVFEIDRFTPFAQWVSLRPYAVLGGGLLVVVLAALALIRGRRYWPLVAGLLAVVLAGAATLMPRVIADPAPATASMTVIAFNAYDGGADVNAVATLIRAERPDFVSLVETGGGYRARLASLIEPLGYRLYNSAQPGEPDLHGVTAIVSARLGDVHTDIDLNLPFHPIAVSGGELGGLRLLAFHSVAPRRGDVGQWRSDLAHLPAWCAGPTPAIVAGDFNATFDNSTFRHAIAGCGDAAAQRGAGLIPTWPTWLPGWIGPQIDHVLATAGITAQTFEVRQLPGSDHRAVIADLHLARPAAGRD